MQKNHQHLKRKKSKRTLQVIFNASVILAGIHSPRGGSGKLLSWVKKKRITGYISEIILDELLRHNQKIGLTQTTLQYEVTKLFPSILSAPSETEVKKFYSVVSDHGDAHLFASCREKKIQYLVSLDKRHILCLKDKVKRIIIVSPKELIESIRQSQTEIKKPRR